MMKISFKNSLISFHEIENKLMIKDTMRHLARVTSFLSMIKRMGYTF